MLNHQSSANFIDINKNLSSDEKNIWTMKLFDTCLFLPILLQKQKK